MKNKLLISFILFILLIFSFINFSNATFDYTSFTYTNEVGNNQGEFTVILPQNASSYPYIFIYNNERYHTFPRIFFSKTELVFDSVLNDKGNYDIQVYSKDGSSFYHYTKNVFLDGSKTWDLSSYVVEDFTLSYGSLNHGTGGNIPYSIFYSTFDVYNSDNTLVFQAAPTQVVTIPGITQVEEIPQVMERVMKILIPIGLIVFLVGLVIYLTRLVISRLT